MSSFQSKKHKALALLNANQIDLGRELLEEIATVGQQDPDIWFMLGTVYGMTGKYGKAEQCNRHILAIQPGHFQAHGNLGAVLREQGKPAEALQHFEEALRINPAYINAHINKGGALNDLGRLEEAKACYQKALLIDPHDGNAHYCLAEACRVTGELDNALHHYQQILRHDSGNANAIAGVVNILKFRKQYSSAMALIESYVSDKDGQFPIKIAVNYAALCRQAGEYDRAIDLLEYLRLQKSVLLNNDDRVALYFNLGSLYDARGDFDRAFETYRVGNNLKSHANEHLVYGQCLASYTEMFTADFMRQAQRADNSSELPVFIIGMPRSGTSLVEQILSSHPRVFGGGELKWVIDVIQEAQAVIGSAFPYPQCLNDASQTHCNILAGLYLRKLAVLSGGQAVRTTDKMTANFWNLGLIALLFPRGRIIHCQRDPMDTCLSIYFQNFSEGHGFAYDLREIGKAYNLYLEMMAHWRKVLDYPILDVHYEDLVNNQESMTRRLLDFCDITWDYKCLQFQDSDRMVFTASSDQVRRPMYKSSIHRWKNYQSHLGPLLEALGKSSPA